MHTYLGSQASPKWRTGCVLGLQAVDGETVLQDGTSGVERLEGGLVGVLEILVAGVGERSLLHGLGHSGWRRWRRQVRNNSNV